MHTAIDAHGQLSERLDAYEPGDDLRGMDGAMLKQWREAHGLSQGDLGVTLCLGYRNVERWESGGQPIPPFLFLALEAIEARLARSTARTAAKRS